MSSATNWHELGRSLEHGAAMRDPASMFGLSQLLAEGLVGADDETSERRAELLLHDAADLGHGPAMTDLGLGAWHDGQREMARSWFERGAAVGDELAAAAVAVELWSQGRLADGLAHLTGWSRPSMRMLLDLDHGVSTEGIFGGPAHRRAQRRAESGSGEAMLEMAEWDQRMSLHTSAESWWAAAVEAGAPGAAFRIGVQRWPRQEAEARRWWLRDAASGGAAGAFNLAVLSLADGDDDAAAQWLRPLSEVEYLRRPLSYLDPVVAELE